MGIRALRGLLDLHDINACASLFIISTNKNENNCVAYFEATMWQQMDTNGIWWSCIIHNLVCNWLGELKFHENSDPSNKHAELSQDEIKVETGDHSQSWGRSRTNIGKWTKQQCSNKTRLQTTMQTYCTGWGRDGPSTATKLGTKWATQPLYAVPALEVEVVTLCSSRSSSSVVVKRSRGPLGRMDMFGTPVQGAPVSPDPCLSIWRTARGPFWVF